MNVPTTAGGLPGLPIEELDLPERIRRLLESVDRFGINPELQRCDELEQRGIDAANRRRDFKMVLLQAQQYANCDWKFNDDLLACNIDFAIDAAARQQCRETAEAAHVACVQPFQAAIDEVDREYLASVAQCRAQAIECRRRVIRDSRLDRDPVAPSPPSTSVPQPNPPTP